MQPSRRCASLARHLGLRQISAAVPFDDPSKDAVSLKCQRLFSVEGKVCLVTGGTKGIGRMIARGLVENGARVYISSRKADMCDAVARELSSAGPGTAVPLPADVSTEAGCVALARRVEELEAGEGGALHVLVNNAGATWGAPFEKYPDAAWQKVMDLNVRSVFNLTKLCASMLERAASAGDPARVINISSVDGLRATQTNGPAAAFAYTASKGALNHLTAALCRALSGRNITVNCIAPGVFPSNMTKFILDSDDGQAAVAQSNPLGRFGRTADMAGAALFLASAASAWVNGAVIPVDGGAVLHDQNLGY